MHKIEIKCSIPSPSTSPRIDRVYRCLFTTSDDRVAELHSNESVYASIYYQDVVAGCRTSNHNWTPLIRHVHMTRGKRMLPFNWLATTILLEIPHLDQVTEERRACIKKSLEHVIYKTSHGQEIMTIE